MDAELFQPYKQETWGKIHERQALENCSKFNSRVGVEEILFATFKSNTKKLKWSYHVLKITNFWIKFS